MITRRVFQCCYPPWISQVIDQPRQRSSKNAIHNAIEAIQIGDRRLDRVAAGKLPPANFGLLQQYLPIAEVKGLG
jgi:hypothetical protein